MKKEKKVFIGGVLGLLLAIFTCYSVSSTYAKYVTEITGSDSARVAKWSWNINTADITNENKTFTMNDLFAAGKVYELTSDACTTTVDAEVKQDGDALVAPGTCGKVAITVVNNSEVDATYSYTLKETNTSGIPIKYSLTGEAGTWKTVTELNTANAKTDILMSDKTKNVDLYWKWDLTGTDAKDTELGFNDGSDTIKLEATMTLEQKD